MAYKTTTDHEEVKKWIEEHGAKPGVVHDNTMDDEDVLTLLFKDSPKDIGTISWDEFFDRFESSNLALRYPEDGDPETDPTFDFSFIDRDRTPGQADDETLPVDDEIVTLENTDPSGPTENSDAFSEEL